MQLRSAEVSSHGRSSRSWHRDGVVNAAMAVNTWDVVDDLKAILGHGGIDLRRVTSVEVPLAGSAARRLGVDDVDRVSVRERVDLAEHVVELELPLVAGDISDVRSAHDVRQ